ncbi:hypothetical protein ScPMuIL_001988 [Solemya velum]
MVSDHEYGEIAKKHIDKGTLVPDDVVIGLVLHDIEALKSNSLLLDGFPRTVSQAEVLVKNVTIGAVINLKIPHDIIINRIKGRWTHVPSGRIYNTDFNPPKVEGKDDVTGEPLVQRDDDKPETVERRLRDYDSVTGPVLNFFRSLELVEDFTGKYSNEIWPRVHKYLSTKTTPLQYTKYN